MRIHISVVFCILLMGVFCTRIDTLREDEVRKDTFLKVGYPVSQPDVVTLQSGNLVMVVRGSEVHTSSNGKVLLSLSKNHGRTWSDPDTIIQTTLDCQRPKITQLKDGLIFVTTTIYRPQKKEPAGCFFVRSFDRGLTFSVPRLIPLFGNDWIKASGGIVELSNGYLLLPVSAFKTGKNVSNLILVSEDRGENWSTYHVIAKSQQDVWYQNPVLVQTADQTILCLMENEQEKGILFVSHSDDGGKSWSPVQRSGLFGWNHDLILSPEGTLLCTYVDESPQGISCSRSYDHGISWEQEVHVAERLRDIVDPSIFFIRKDRAAVCYTEYKENKWTVKASVFLVQSPSKPHGLSASLHGAKTIHIRWNQVQGASYYLVYRSTDPDFIPQYGSSESNNVIAMPIVPKYVDSQVHPGVTYYYRISAVNGHGKLMPHTGNEGEISDLLTVQVK
jgi:hypothetical protein